MKKVVHELAGKPPPRSLLENIPRLVSAYYTHKPDVSDPEQRVSFGTSGHRGSALRNSFNEHHVLAISQAICEHRKAKGITGPLFMGMDTHALSEAALASGLEVFAANGVRVMIQKDFGYTPTPVISHAILTYNRGKEMGLADGVVITPSHNPPSDGGFKYNPPEGGPADTQTTTVIEKRANEILASGLKEVKRLPFERALKADTTREYDFITPYVEDLLNIIDMEIIAKEGIRIGVDPLGGSAVNFWDPIAEKYNLSIEVVNRSVDPTFAFMTVDKDGKIRMDCSSKYAMAGLIQLKDNFDIAFGNDADCDRHGIVTRSDGLMNPNHYLAVAVWYLFQNRPAWKTDAAVGKTLVSSSMIDRVSAKLGRKLSEVPVGFKWFVDGLLDGTYGFGGEESAGASFLRKDGTVWTTDKDGIIMDLLACEITAAKGKDPAELYKDLEDELGSPLYERIDAPATVQQKEVLKNLSPRWLQQKYSLAKPSLLNSPGRPATTLPLAGLKL
jgi:phosphoglucomutase